MPTVRHLLSFLGRQSEGSDLFTGSLLRSSLLQWLSPSDPSTNHNIASDAHHDGTAQWFFKGSIFKEWKSAGSFLWIHGKRVFDLNLLRATSPDHLLSHSGLGEECTQVCPSSTRPTLSN